MERFTIDKENTAVLVIDIQEKLAAVMEKRESVVRNSLHLIETAKILGLPLLVTEQYPKGLGHTVEELRNALHDYSTVEKMAFNCCDDPACFHAIKILNRKNLIIAGMETHICVLQTCLGLLDGMFHVQVVSDAVCSRAEENRRTALEFMRDAGAVITCTETVLFQLLKVAGTDEFKAVSKRIK